MTTIEEIYYDLVNNNPSWIEPVLNKNTNPKYSMTHFQIDIKDFKEISCTPYVRIYNLRKWEMSMGEIIITIHCEIQS